MDHLEDGTLRMLVQAGYRPNDSVRYPQRIEYIRMSSYNHEYSVDGDGNPNWAEQEGVSVRYAFKLFDSGKEYTSIPEDTHDVVGYRGSIEYVSIMPYDDGTATIGVMVNEKEIQKGDLWMSRIRMEVLDEEGNVLGDAVEIAVDSIFAGREARRTHALYLASISAKYIPMDGSFTLRLQNANNPAYVYDVYTYTMK